MTYFTRTERDVAEVAADRDRLAHAIAHAMAAIDELANAIESPDIPAGPATIADGLRAEWQNLYRAALLDAACTDPDCTAADLYKAGNDTAHQGHVWLSEPPPGGWVCATPVPGLPGGICGMPVESEPCPEHGDTSIIN